MDLKVFSQHIAHLPLLSIRHFCMLNSWNYLENGSSGLDILRSIFLKNWKWLTCFHVVIPYCLIKSHCNNRLSNNNKRDKGNNSLLQLRTDAYSPPYSNIYVTGEVRREIRQFSTVGDLSQQVTVGSVWDPWRALPSVSEIFEILDVCSNSLFCFGLGFLQYV